jgi:hypothetical protein
MILGAFQKVLRKMGSAAFPILYGSETMWTPIPFWVMGYQLKTMSVFDGLLPK